MLQHNRIGFFAENTYYAYNESIYASTQLVI